jgi:hypothetical protein
VTRLLDQREHDLAEPQRAESGAEQVRVRHPLLRRQPAAEVPLDRRQRHVDDRAVDRHHGGAEDGREQRHPLPARHGAGGGLFCGRELVNARGR